VGGSDAVHPIFSSQNGVEQKLFHVEQFQTGAEFGILSRKTVVSR
jgi:hypothetical protein